MSSAPKTVESIRLLHVLVFFDGPQLVICQDAGGNYYLGSAVPDTVQPIQDVVLRYPIALSKVSVDTLNRYLLGFLDTRTACTLNAQNTVVMIDFFAPNSEADGTLTGYSAPLEDDMLAGEGLLLTDVMTSEALQNLLETGAPVTIDALLQAQNSEKTNA